MYFPAPGLSAYSTPRALRPMARHLRRRGMGAPQSTAQQYTGSLAAGASYGASTAITTGSPLIGAISGALVAAAPIPVAGPFIAAAGALVGTIANLFKGCGATCQQTTNIANQVESAAQQIMSQYWASPVRTTSMQSAAVASLQQLYQYLIQSCNSIGGQGGKQCVADRQPGGKYDFQAQQIAPIQNDSAVVPDTSVAASSSSNTGGTSPLTSGTLFGLPVSSLLLPGALILAAIAFFPSEKKR